MINSSLSTSYQYERAAAAFKDICALLFLVKRSYYHLLTANLLKTIPKPRPLPLSSNGPGAYSLSPAPGPPLLQWG